jgi:hypothetical protein
MHSPGSVLAAPLALGACDNVESQSSRLSRALALGSAPRCSTDEEIRISERCISLPCFHAQALPLKRRKSSQKVIFR